MSQCNGRRDHLLLCRQVVLARLGAQFPITLFLATALALLVQMIGGYVHLNVTTFMAHLAIRYASELGLNMQIKISFHLIALSVVIHLSSNITTLAGKGKDHSLRYKMTSLYCAVNEAILSVLIVIKATWLGPLFFQAILPLDNAKKAASSCSTT